MIYSYFTRLTQISICALLVICVPIQAASVVELSPEEFAQYGPEDAYWTVQVTCDTSDAENIIQRKTDGNSWCVKGDTSLCSEQKNTAANLACSDEFLAKLESDNARENARKREQRLQEERQRQVAARPAAVRVPAKAPVKSPLNAPVVTAIDPEIQKRISIEEQRLSIEQERLKLRRRELKLEQRKVEIQELLEKLG